MSFRDLGSLIWTSTSNILFGTPQGTATSLKLSCGCPDTQAVVDFFQKLCRAAALLQKELPDVQLATWRGRPRRLFGGGLKIQGCSVL